MKKRGFIASEILIYILIGLGVALCVFLVYKYLGGYLSDFADSFG